MAEFKLEKFKPPFWLFIILRFLSMFLKGDMQVSSYLIFENILWKLQVFFKNNFLITNRKERCIFCSVISSYNDNL